MSLLSLFTAAGVAAAVMLPTPTGTIHGTELVPGGAGPFPVVLIIAGSGPTDRDGNSRLLKGPNDSLRQLAQGLAEKGVASVRYDKRGIAGSAGAGVGEADLRFEHLVDDAAGWVGKLKADARFSRVVVVGHSEGSLIGMLAARKAGAAAFVSVAGLARRGDQVLREQLKGRLPPELAKESDRILEALVAGKLVPDARAELAMLYRPSVQPYLISWLRHHPGETIKTLGIPVLVAQGTHDLQVGVSDAQSLSEAASQSALVLVDGMNHVLKMAPAEPSAQLPTYSDPSFPIARPLVEAIAAFTLRGG